MARSTSSPVAVPDTPVSGVSGRPFALNLLNALRPSQWTKNLLVFAGLLFGMQLFVPSSVLRALAAFGIFCGLSGVVDLLNDIVDRDSDRRHPIKSKPPIASGALSVHAATVAAIRIGALALRGSVEMGWTFAFPADRVLRFASPLSGVHLH